MNDTCRKLAQWKCVKFNPLGGFIGAKKSGCVRRLVEKDERFTQL